MGERESRQVSNLRARYSAEVEFDVQRDLLGDSMYPYFLNTLSKVATKPDDSMNAIFIPAARGVTSEYVGRIASVARETNTKLFTLVSHEACSGKMADLLDDASVPEWWVVGVPNEGHELPFMKFKSPDAIPDNARKTPPSNLSQKRNIGSLIGRSMGWERILFSDDDLVYEPADLRAVSLMLPGHKIAGMKCGPRRRGSDGQLLGFPDKDVVHHAEDAIILIHSSYSVHGTLPDAGHISGNSIATNPKVSGLVFPPEIYNEDLIAFHDMYFEHSAALAERSYYFQAPYDPFADPKRAETEAFGEIVYEALYLSLLKGHAADMTDLRHWNETIVQRKVKIETLLRGLAAPQDRRYFGYMTQLPERDPVQESRMRESLLAGLSVTQTFKGIMGVDYFRLWSEDKTTWRNCVAEMPDRQSIPDVLGWLGLSFLSNKA